MLWKKAGLVCIVLAALAVVAYAQSTKQRAHSANIQVPMSSGYLGVWIQEVSPERAKALNLKDDSGVEVTAMTEDAPAAKAGLRVHDVILDISGQKVDNQEQFVESISGKAPGTKINLTVLRGGVKQTISATLGLRPPDAPVSGVPPGVFTPRPISPEELQMMIAAQNAVDAPRVGFDGVDLGPQLAEYFGVREGVLVAQVYEKTPAERAGLKAGDVVTKVNGVPVASAREISGVVRVANKKLIAFTVVRYKKEITLNVEIAWNRPGPFDPGAIN